MNRETFRITRMSPGESSIVFDTPFEDKFEVLIGVSRESALIHPVLKIGEFTYEANGLENNTDYLLLLQNAYGEETLVRPFRCGSYPGKVINYIHPEDKTFLPSGMCPASPSILEAASGRLYVSHDIFCNDYAQNQTKVFCSDDLGNSWRFHSEIEGCLWGKLFAYEGGIYSIGCLHEYGDLVLYKMDESSFEWNKACTIMKGGNKFTGGPHQAPMPITSYKGRIWTSLEFGSWPLGGHACGIVFAKGDITKAENWSVSDFTEYNPSWPGVPKGKSSGCIEGNIVITPDGKMINFLRFGIENCEPNYGKALYLTIDTEKPQEAPEFGGIVDFHGNHSKFCINYDESTGRYWTIANKADNLKPKRRNELVLMSSPDSMKWTIEKTLLDYEHNDWYENDAETGFQYVDFIFHGDFIFFISRTAINGARNYHDSNCITFHTTRYK